RITASQTPAEPKLLNPDPITSTQFADKNFKFGEKYTYFVRAVSLGTEGKPVESLNSNTIELSPLDVYKPAAPNLTPPNAIPGRVALFWVPNTETDVVGYDLYRSTDPNVPKAQWLKLTPQLYTKTTFQDENVENGKTYYYYLVAVDSAGNRSDDSQVVSATVP